VKKQKTVYIGMCADLLHPGHLNIIKEGAKHGRVIVGLLTDEAVASYKRRPIISFQDRKTILEHIKGVGQVIPQTTLDYRPNLLRLKPDFVVHGTDWQHGVQTKTRQQVIDTLAKWGGVLVEPAYTEGISTTEIIQKIQNASQSFVQGHIPTMDLDTGPLHFVNRIANTDGGVDGRP
jgi:phosphoenolpyruvate phosphomutase / 2-hydroxyethylphosphonate cytidylyltransferase